MTTNEQLRSMMERHNLTRADVARLLGLKVTRYSNGTVDSWLSGHRNCPPAKLELLAIKAKQNEKGRCHTTRRPAMTTNELFTRIAQTHLHIETLETRHRDSLDFHDVGVWCVRDALQAAYEAGIAEGLRQVGRMPKQGEKSTKPSRQPKPSARLSTVAKSSA